MRFLLISLFYFGLPLWAAVRSPLNAGINEVAVQFAQFVAVQTVIAMLFLTGAVVLDRCLSGQWVWNDVVLVHRRSDAATIAAAVEARMTAEEAMFAERNKKLKEELDAQYRAWLFHK